MGLVLFALNQKKASPPTLEFAPSGLETGHSAPDFSLPDLDGRTVALSDYRGKVVLVNIWATWCPPCVAEMPSMVKLYRQMEGSDFEILAVSIDEGGADTLAPFVKKHNLTFPILLDPQGTIKSTYRITGVPESFVVNRQGLLVKKVIGPLDWADREVLDFFRQLMQQ
jgi:peroxiredoxin